jgi:hypothetical protein
MAEQPPEIGETQEDLADYLSYWYNEGHPVQVIKRKQISEITGLSTTQASY